MREVLTPFRHFRPCFRILYGACQKFQNRRSEHWPNSGILESYVPAGLRMTSPNGRDIRLEDAMFGPMLRATVLKFEGCPERNSETWGTRNAEIGRAMLIIFRQSSDP